MPNKWVLEAQIFVNTTDWRFVMDVVNLCCCRSVSFLKTKLKIYWRVRHCGVLISNCAGILVSCSKVWTSKFNFWHIFVSSNELTIIIASAEGSSTRTRSVSVLSHPLADSPSKSSPRCTIPSSPGPSLKFGSNEQGMYPSLWPKPRSLVRMSKACIPLCGLCPSKFEGGSGRVWSKKVWGRVWEGSSCTHFSPCFVFACSRLRRSWGIIHW